MSGSFVLVASYPKSGNTWTRIIFEKLRRGAGKAFSINELDASYHGISRRFAFDSYVPVNAADLLTEELENFLPDFYRQLAAKIDGKVFLKAHDAAKRNGQGEWLYPPGCIHSVIYLVRHPYDVAVSTAHHLSVSVERAVDIMGDDGSSRPPYRNLSESLPQTFGSWSGNVVSWLDNTSYHVICARYEDLHADPVGGFLRLAQAAGLDVSTEQVAQAVNTARFGDLQREEEEAGFRERPESSPKFFRAGHPRTWEQSLGIALRDRLVRAHGVAMERLGYGADGSVESFANIQPGA